MTNSAFLIEQLPNVVSAWKEHFRSSFFKVDNPFLANSAFSISSFAFGFGSDFIRFPSSVSNSIFDSAVNMAVKHLFPKSISFSPRILKPRFGTS